MRLWGAWARRGSRRGPRVDGRTPRRACALALAALALGQPAYGWTLPIAAPVQGAGAGYDPARLTPGSYRYRVVVGEDEVGRVATRLQRDTRSGREAFHATSAFRTVTGEVQEVELWFDAETFAPIRTSGTGRQGGYAVSIDLEYRPGRVTGRVAVDEPTDTANRVQPVDLALPPGTVDQNQVRYALASAPLEVGYAFEIPVFDVTQAELMRLTFRVSAIETVKVPAGRFRAFRIDMTGGSLPMTWYVTTDAPRRVVRQEFDAGGSRLHIELLPPEP